MARWLVPRRDRRRETNLGAQLSGGSDERVALRHLDGWHRLHLDLRHRVHPDLRHRAISTSGTASISTVGARSSWRAVSCIRASISAIASVHSSCSASIHRWRSVSAPIVLTSLMWFRPRNFRQRLRPHRRWLSSSSETAQLFASQGQRRMISAAEICFSAMRRFRSARASLTSFARSRARRRCGDSGVAVAVSIM